MKRGIGIFFYLAILMTSLVSAAGPVDGLRVLLWGLRDAILEVILFISNLLWDIDTFDEFLLAKILLLVIIYFIVFTILSKNAFLGNFRSNKGIYIIISASISILSIYFMPDEFMNLILIQYTTFGIAITTFIPLMVFFLFVHQSNIGPFGRRAAWILYLLIFLVMWGVKGDTLGVANWVYTGALLFVIISLIFDKSIHQYFGLSDFRRAKRNWEEENLMHLERRYVQLMKDYRQGLYRDREDRFEEKRRELLREIREQARRT